MYIYIYICTYKRVRGAHARDLPEAGALGWVAVAEPGNNEITPYYIIVYYTIMLWYTLVYYNST